VPAAAGADGDGAPLVDDGGGGSAWLIVGASALIVAAGAAVAIFLLTRGEGVSDETTFGAPVIQGF